MNIAQKLQTIAENEQKVYEAGHEAGYGVGHEAGQKAEHERVWNEFQQNGNRVNYPYGFCGPYWNDNTYDPIHPIIITNSAAYFFAFNSQCTSTKVPITINTATSTYAFNGCTRLKTIPSLTVTKKTVFTGWLYGASALETLNVYGTIANNLDLHDCTKLTHESLMSIINALQDKTGTSGTWTVTLGSTNKAKLTEAELLIAENKGWVVQ